MPSAVVLCLCGPQHHLLSTDHLVRPFKEGFWLPSLFSSRVSKELIYLFCYDPIFSECFFHILIKDPTGSLAEFLLVGHLRRNLLLILMLSANCSSTL